MKTSANKIWMSTKGENQRKNDVKKNSAKRKKKKKRANDLDGAHKMIELSPAKGITRSNDSYKTSTSLQSLLKRRRGTAATTSTPSEWSEVASYIGKSKVPRYLEPDDSGFQSCKEQCYHTFCYEDPEDLPQILHSSFISSLDKMNEAGLFLYDVVNPGGKKLSQTFVTRTLVGDPGSTYKYLGLRLFSHPWCDVDKNGDGMVHGILDGENVRKIDSGKIGRSLRDLGYSTECSKALVEMGLINQFLAQRTDSILKNEIAGRVKDGLVGSAQYTLTLINKMEPTSMKKDLKDEKIHGLGKTSVSWHKDSGLQDFSSIAVYHTLKDMGGRSGKDKSEPWKVALRVADDSRTPALSIPLPSGALYYLLDDFNHNHEHAVISGSDSIRYSSTHRVARDGAGSWIYVREKCQRILSFNLCKIGDNLHNLQVVWANNAKKNVVKEFRACEQLMTELEFEWIRQWFIQGKLHSKIHVYWHKPIEYIKETYIQLENICNSIYKALEKPKLSSEDLISEELFDAAIEALQHREDLRKSFDLRLKDPIFNAISENERPFGHEFFENLQKISSSDVRHWKSTFHQNQDISQKGKKRKSEDKTAGMTKKEKRYVPSNWEKLRNKM